MALLSLQTGIRAGEIFRLKAHDVDVSHGLITVLDAKNRQSRRVYMSGAVRDMMSRRVSALKPDDYVFVGRRTKAPYSEIADYFKTTANRLFKSRHERPSAACHVSYPQAYLRFMARTSWGESRDDP